MKIISHCGSYWDRECSFPQTCLAIHVVILHTGDARYYCGGGDGGGGGRVVVVVVVVVVYPIVGGKYGLVRDTLSVYVYT